MYKKKKKKENNCEKNFSIRRNLWNVVSLCDLKTSFLLVITVKQSLSFWTMSDAEVGEPDLKSSGAAMWNLMRQRINGK